MFRKHVSMLQLETLFKNPRTHTNKGYRKKQDEPVTKVIPNYKPALEEKLKKATKSKKQKWYEKLFGLKYAEKRG